MQKLNDDDVLVNSSPTSVSSGYCSQWMSPSTYGFSKQSASERTLCTESEFESDCGVNQKLLREFHCIRPKTHKSRSKLLPSGVQVAKKKLTCARKHKKSLHCESEALKCVLLRLNSASFPHSRNAVRSSSPDLPLSGLVESPLKRYSLNSGHAINSDKLLASTTSSLSKKRSKWPKKCLASLCACKVRYLTVNICRLPAGIKSMNVKNIGNSLCWFQSATQMLDSKVRHKRTKNGFKQLHSNSDIIQLQSNSDCKQIKSCSYLKKLQSKNSKQLKSKSDVKYAKLSHEKKQCALTGVERQLELKCDVKHLKSNKCKDSSNKADIEKEHHKVTEAKHSCGVIHNSRSVSVKSKGLESYKSNAVQMQYDSFTKTNPVSLCRISDFNRPRKKRLNHEQYNKVTDTTYGSNDSTVHESPISHCVSASGFHSIKEKLDSHVSAFRCHSAFSSGKHNRKHSDTSENLIPKDHHTHRKVKCRFTGKSKCRCQQCHRRPRYSVFRLVHRPTRVLCKYVLPKSCHKQRFIRYRKHWRSSTNTEAYANEVLTDEADWSLSRHKSPYVTDIQNKLPQHDSETAVKPDRRNLFDTFLNEIPSTSQQNLTTEEVTSKPEMSAIQNSGKHHNNSLMSTSDYSAKDLDLPEPSDLSVQLRAENSRTELFEASDRLLDTNDDKYSDISDDILPDAVSNMYDMFSDISDCLPDDIPVNESTHGGRLSDTCRSMLNDSVALWANDLHSLWLQSQCFSLPTSDMSLELIKTNATESHDDKNKEALLTPEDSSCSDNHHEDFLNCQEPCSTLIQNNLPVSDNTCHSDIQTNSSSQRRPCSLMVTTISKGPRCSEIEVDDSLCKGRCSCGQIQTSEAPSPFDRPCCCMVNQTSEVPCSAESMKDSSLCKGPCSFGVNQTTLFTSDSVGPFSADVQEGSSPTSRGAAEETMASDGPCTYEKQRLHSCGGPSSNESHPGISPCGILYSLDVSQKSTSEELCSTESDENTLNSAVHECSAVESTNEGSLSPKLQEGTVASCASYIQNESASGLQSSAEIPDSTLTCEAPGRFLKTQNGLSSAKESESTICEHSSSEAFGSGNILETIHNSERIWSSNIYKENLTYEGPYEFGVNDDEQVPEIPCSGESFVLEIPFSEGGPVFSEICNAEEGLLDLGATYSKEGFLVSDATCFKEGPLISERPCCTVGPLVTDVISEDSCSREELLILEEPCCKESPLVSEEPISNNGPLIPDRSYTNVEGPPVSDLPCFKEGRLTSETPCFDGVLVSEDVTLKEILTPESCGSHKGSMTLEVSGSDMLQIGLAEPQEGFSSVQDIEDLLTAGASCLSETNDVSLTLEDLFPFVLQEPSERFADRLDYEDLLSYEMQEGTPVESQIDNTQENSLIAPTSCIVTFQEELCKADILKNLLNSGKSGSKESEEPESNEMNSDNLETGSQSESFLAKFYEFTNVWRPSAASESESDGDDTDREDDADSLDETRNECISDANGTSFETVPVVTMPHCPARAKTESWLQEYQLQMLENEERTHKNWKLLVSVIDDPRSGRCGRRKGTSGNWPRKRKSSPGTNKTRLQPKRLCATTQNFEQTEPERSEEDFLVLQQDFCSVDSTSQSHFSFDGVMANFQNMVLNGDSSMLSMFIDQANTWLSMENTETIIDLADLGQSGVNIYSELELTAPLASDSLTSDNNTLSIAPEQNDLLDSASALPVQQPESIVTSGLPGLALDSATSTDAQTVAMLSDNCGNIESLNVLSSDAGTTLQTVVPGFTEVSELDAEMLQYLLSVFPQLGHAGALPGISYNQSNEIVTNTDVTRGVIYVLNHSNCLTQLVDCGQILGGDPVQECNKPKTGSQCQVEGQTFTPVLILTNGNTTSAKVDNPTSTQHSDSGLCTAQNSSEEIRPGLFEGDPQPTQNNCPLVDIDDFRANNAACASNLEQQIDVVESALLSVKHDVLESQQQSRNTLVLEKNDEISDSSGSSSAPLTDGYFDDHTHQNSAAVLLEKDCSSGTVLVEKGSELSRNECSDNVLAKSCSDSMSVHPLQNDLSNENNQNQSELPTGDKLLGHHDCGIEHLADSCRTLGSASGNYATSVDQQGTSGSEYSSDADLHQRSNAVSSSDPNGLSVGEDSLSDKSDPFVLTCEDAGDNADIFLEEAEDNCSETSDVIMLGCNDSFQNHWENYSETTHFNVAMSSAQEQHASRENYDASKDHGVSAVVLLKDNQSSFENGNQKSKYFVECIQKNSKEGNQKSSDVVNGKSSEDSEIQIEEFNNNCYETSQHFLEADKNKSSKEACQAVRSGSCEEEVITKVVCSNLAKFNAANESNLSPNLRPVVLHPHGSVLILGDKLTSEENNKVKTKLKESKRFDRAEGKKSDTIKSQLFSSIAPVSIPENTNRLRNKRASTEVNMVEIKLKKSKPISRTKRKPSRAIESQGLQLTAPDRIAQKRNDHVVRQTICSGGVTEPSFNRSKEQTEENLNNSRVKEKSSSRVQTVEPVKVNSCTKHARTLKHCQNGIKLRIVKVRRGIWQTQSSTDPVTQQYSSHKAKSAASASNDNCTVSSDNISSYQDRINISDESDSDTEDCLCIDDESCPPNNRLVRSAKRTISNQITSFLPTSAVLHRIGCTCVSCAERQFLYGRDNTVSMFTDVSLTRGLMRYKRSLPANRNHSQINSVASVGQSPVVIDDLDGSNSDMPIHIS